MLNFIRQHWQEQEQNTTSLSQLLLHPWFELIPLKKMEQQTNHLPAHAKVTVTCSPKKGLEATLRASERLNEQGFQVIPHLTARLVRDKFHLKDILERLRANNLEEVFIPGGDIPQPVGQFSSALELLYAIDELGHQFREVGITGYPEGHPQIDENKLQEALADKQPFATYMVTQLCFSQEKILQWIREMRHRQIHIPVHIGIPGAAEAKKLLQISLKIGIGDSLRFLRKNTSILSHLFRYNQFTPHHLVKGLAPYLDDPQYNIRDFHIYTFNQIERTEKWRHQMLHQLQ